MAARWPEGAVRAADAGGTAGRTVGFTGRRSSRSAPAARRPLRRLGSSAWRAGSVAAGIVVFSASARRRQRWGADPRPVRVVAYTVGLPVDSPALDDTNQHIEELKKAVKANDKPKAQATVRRLQTDLTKVPGHEKEEAEQKVDAVIERPSHKMVPTPSPTTTTTAPRAHDDDRSFSRLLHHGHHPEEGPRRRRRTRRADARPTTAPTTTTTTDPESTTTTTAPETDENPSGGMAPPANGGPVTAWGRRHRRRRPGSTTTTTTPARDETTTTTTAAPPAGDVDHDAPPRSRRPTSTMPPPGAPWTESTPAGAGH